MTYASLHDVVVRFKGGAAIADAAYDVQRLADQTGVRVRGAFSATEISAEAGGNWRDIVARFIQDRGE